VIGRRFDLELLAAAADDGGDIDARLGVMQALDLVYPEAKSGEYSFKHALVRDALYRSLLTGPRVALHLKSVRRELKDAVEAGDGNGAAQSPARATRRFDPARATT